MGEKDDKYATTSTQAHPYEFVGSNVLNYLVGSTQEGLRHQRDHKLQKISFIYIGSVRKYSFYDAAKVAYPKLTDYEIARLRVDINERILEARKRNKAEKSRSKE